MREALARSRASDPGGRLYSEPPSVSSNRSKPPLISVDLSEPPPVPPDLSEPFVGTESFEDLARVILPLVPRQDDRPGLLRDNAAIMLDGLLVRVVRGQGAVDLAIGRDLHALSRGKLLRHLGYVRLGDYARERLGIPEGTAREFVRLAKGLESLPAIRNAVWSGEVEASKGSAAGNDGGERAGLAARGPHEDGA